MANSIFRPGYHGLGLFCFMLLMVQKGYAKEFSVNWGLHNGSNSVDYNQWAEKNRFQIGDSLVFTYDPNSDSVLHVTMEAYKNCSVESPLSTYTDGHTVFSLDHSGPYYFISGKQENCQKNEKLVVVVLAHRISNRSSTTNETLPPSPPPLGSTPPSPPPSGSTPPSPTPMDITPAPAPSVESPPTGTPAPSTEETKPNAASSVFTGVAASAGAFVASTFLLAF